jgi:hypothetical protein
MDIGKAFTYVFDDPEWPSKVGLGVLISMTPVVNFMGYGYEVQLARNVARGAARPLPAWNQLEILLVDAVWLGLAQLIYILPVLGLGGCGALALVPIFAAAVQGQTDAQVGRGLAVFGLAGMGLFASIMALSFVMGLALPAVTVQYVRRGQFGACFRFGEMWSLVRDNLKAYVLLWLGVWVAQLGLSFAVGALGMMASFIPCFGTMITLILLGGLLLGHLLVQGHLVGQLLQADAARRAAAAALPPSA